MTLALNRRQPLNGNKNYSEFFNGYELIQNSLLPGMNSATSLMIQAAKKSGRSKRTLDLGCGQGAAGFAYWAYGNTEGLVSIDVQLDVLTMFEQSICKNGLNDKIFLVNGDYRVLSSLFKADSFDLILFNPPFYYNGNLSENRQRRKSFFRESPALGEIFKMCYDILNDRGRIVLVYPVKEVLILTKELMENRFGIRDLLFYRDFENQLNKKLCAVIARKNVKTDTKIEEIVLL